MNRKKILLVKKIFFMCPSVHITNVITLCVCMVSVLGFGVGVVFRVGFRWVSWSGFVVGFCGQVLWSGFMVGFHVRVLGSGFMVRIHGQLF